MEEIWREPVRGGYPDVRALGWSGLEQLQAAIRIGGPRAPISHLTGMAIASVDASHASFAMPASDWFLSSQERISAGALTMLADAAFGCGVMIGLPPATPFTTSELSMTFVAPCPAGGMITAVGRPVHFGDRLALSEARITDGGGNLVAFGTSSCFLLPTIEGIEPFDGDPPFEAPSYDSPDPFERPASGDVIPWDDWRTMSGEEILARQIKGELPQPPIHYLTGMTIREVANGRVVFTMPASQWLTSPARTVQGGATAMLAQSALATAVTSTLEPGEAYRPVDVKVNYLRPVFPDGKDLVATGVVTHRGRTLAVATSEVVNAEGKKVALATGSTMILPERP